MKGATMKEDDAVSKKNYVVITGGSKGLGYELAKVFARNEYDLILVARNKDDLARTAAKLEDKYGIKCFVFACDLSKITEVDKFYREVINQRLKVSILINNAGFGHWGKFEEMDPDLQVEMLNLNITGLSHLTRLFVEDMIKNGFGKVLNVSSIASFVPTPFTASYAASKTYVKYFSLALDYELRDKNVRVSTLCSPDFYSGFQKRAGNPNLKIKGPYTGTAEKIAEITFSQFMKNKTIIKPYTFFGKLMYYLENYVPIPESLKIEARKSIVENDYMAKNKGTLHS